MNSEQKNTLKLTLMAFDNNCGNVKNLRLDEKNKLGIGETQALLKIEQKMDDVKRSIIRLLIDAEEIIRQRKENIRITFLNDNVD